MIRWITVCVLLSSSAIAAVWLMAPHLTPAAARLPTAKEKEEPGQPEPPAAPPRGGATASGRRGQPEVIVYRNNNPKALGNLILIPGATLVIIEKQEVSSEKDGIIVFIGTDDVQSDDMVPPEKKLPDAELGFLAVRLGENDPVREGDIRFHFKNDPVTWYRRIRDREELQPKKVVLSYETRKVRKLQVGDRVKRDQLLALINPRKAFDDVATKVSKLDGVEWERYSAMKQKEEMARRWQNQVNLNIRQPGAVSQDEISQTKVQQEKFAAEEKVKEQEIVTAQRTLNAALTDLKMHEIRAAIDGVIKVISKNHQGEAVKVNEPILQIQNPARLRVEGRLEWQEARNLKEGMPVIVEASRPEAPRLVISGHLAAVNGVAVSKGKRPIIVSGSDDETLRGWDAANGDKLWKLSGLRSAVRCVACTPPAAKANLVCFGCADGSVRVLDLDNVEKKPREMSERHRRPVHGVAFSPDGDVCATCGDDRSICLWKTASGELLHRLVNAHSGPVTSVYFASAKRLVSAGEDKRLIVWDVEAGKPPRSIGPRFEGRGGEVLTLGASPDGRTVLFDQGKELRLLTLEDKQIVGSLQNSSDAMNFSTMALFAPDGKTILTNGSAPGKLQLWRTPLTQTRGSELRQFIWKGTATCGAFAPENGSFAVTGTQDHQVLVWSMPDKEEVESRLEARLTLVERYLDTRSRHVRVWAELESPEWLLPGMQATMVIVPPQK